MRYLLVMAMTMALAAPAFAADRDTSVAAPQAVTSPAPQKSKPRHEKAQGMTNLHEVDTVAKALKAPDRNPVMIVGHVVEKVDGKKNRFIVDDGTGRMAVSIGHKTLKGMTLTPDMKVRLVGKVKTKEGREPVVAVKTLHVLN
ncbi:MAG: hypothetical protein DESF_01106 [Desulfovibrio sp.]